MNATELRGKVAEGCPSIPKKTVNEVLDVLADTIVAELARANTTVALLGIGHITSMSVAPKAYHDIFTRKIETSPGKRRIKWESSKPTKRALAENPIS